jgi:hypothetical protein
MSGRRSAGAFLPPEFIPRLSSIDCRLLSSSNAYATPHTHRHSLNGGQSEHARDSARSCASRMYPNSSSQSGQRHPSAESTSFTVTSEPSLFHPTTGISVSPRRKSSLPASPGNDLIDLTVFRERNSHHDRLYIIICMRIKQQQQTYQSSRRVYSQTSPHRYC